MRTALLIGCLALSAAWPTAAVAQGLIDPDAVPSRPEDEMSVPLAEPRHVAMGMTMDETIAGMQGEPDAKLSPEIWVYRNFELTRDWELRRYDTLVVFFSRGRIHQCQVVEWNTLAELVGDVRKTPTPAQPQMLSELPQLLAAAGAPPRPPRRIGVGMTADDVVRAMQGQPSVQLASDLWVYWDFRAWAQTASARSEALLIGFEGGRVARYQLVSPRALSALAGPGRQLVKN